MLTSRADLGAVLGVGERAEDLVSAGPAAVEGAGAAEVGDADGYRDPVQVDPEEHEAQAPLRRIREAPHRLLRADLPSPCRRRRREPRSDD